jgi:hypothetical protein
MAKDFGLSGRGLRRGPYHISKYYESLINQTNQLVAFAFLI